MLQTMTDLKGSLSDSYAVAENVDAMKYTGRQELRFKSGLAYMYLHVVDEVVLDAEVYI